MSLTLAYGQAVLELELQGAVVTRLDIRGRPILHPARGDVSQNPTLGACFPMLPWCNRLSMGEIATREGVISRAANWPSTPFPVHGHGWQEMWQLLQQGQRYIHLRSQRDEPPGYSYSADLKVALHETGATFVVSVTNTGRQAMPFGLGLHPYFSRDSLTLLTLPANKMVTMGTDGLPDEECAVKGKLDFRVARTIGLGALSVFYPDTRSASVTTGSESVSLRCGGCLRHLMLWAPEDLPFVCIEPMSHRVDAFSHRPSAMSHDLRPGTTMTGWVAVSMQLRHR